MAEQEEGQAAPVTLTHTQATNRLEEIRSELERLASRSNLAPEEEQYVSELRDEFARVDQHRARMELQADLARVRQVTDQLRERRLHLTSTSPGGPAVASSGDYDRDAILEPDSIAEQRFRSPWDTSEIRTFGRDPEDLSQEIRSRALCAVAKMSGASDKVRETAAQFLETADDEGASLSRLCLATSSPEYLRAWSKMARDPRNFMAALTAKERDALNTSRQVQRAMSLTDASGGYLIPFQLDPTIILTSDGSYNDIRSIARKVVATGDVWNGVSAGAVSWSFDAEAAEVSDDAPTLASPAITVRTARGFVPISLEARMDAANVTQEVGRLLAQGKDDLEAVAFVTGVAASNEPIGIVTALTGVANSITASAAADTFAFADLYTVEAGLVTRYSRRAAWLANRGFYSLVRQNAPDGLWKDPTGSTPGQLLGYPVYVADAMDGVINAGADNYLAILGDFSNYVIADRIGMTVDFIPHLFGANFRPTGQSGWFAYYRVGADSVNDPAFQMYNVT